MNVLPLNWLSRWLLDEGRYGAAHLKSDVTAGLTVALVLIPQSMASAQLAGLPFYYGLYAAFLPPAVAALLGSSRQLATGPVAVVSLMTAAALEPVATAGSEAYIAAAVLLSLLEEAAELRETQLGLIEAAPDLEHLPLYVGIADRVAARFAKLRQRLTQRVVRGVQRILVDIFGGSVLGHVLGGRVFRRAGARTGIRITPTPPPASAATATTTTAVVITRARATATLAADDLVLAVLHLLELHEPARGGFSEELAELREADRTLVEGGVEFLHDLFQAV